MLAAWAPLPLRLALGAIFLVHGAAKLWGDAAPVAALLAARGFPFPGALALALGAAELAVGALLVLGAYTRPAALMAAGIMLGALALVKLGKGFPGAEFELLILAAAVALFLSGPGRLALDPPGDGARAGGG